VANEIEAKVRHRFSESPERVFDAWLDVDTVRSWMSMPFAPLGGRPVDVRRVEIDPRVGGRFTFSDMREDGEAVHWGTYLEIDRPRKLVFTWFTSEEEEQASNSVVTLTIEPDSDGCVATIVHAMDVKWAAYIEQTEQGWSGLLNNIGQRLRMRLARSR
jgi:uncharacterized protein YndB with AHSA1/START domain